MLSTKFKIESINAYEVIDSRGFPTVACVVKSANGIVGKAMVPSGASTGEREALELRDGNNSRFMGKGVLKAVDNVNKIIAPALIGHKMNNQKEIDQIMIDLDGTESKSKLGANAILAVSLAVAHCAANVSEKPLYKYIREDVVGNNDTMYKMPVPMLNVINGGAHADNTVDFQEFMFMPIGATSFRHAMQIASECFYALQSILKKAKHNTGKGDEGGFAPNLRSAEEVLDLMIKAIIEAGYKPGINATDGVNADVAIALDVAASEMFDLSAGEYNFKKALDAGIMSSADGVKPSPVMVEYLRALSEKYPIVSIEDGLAENDWEGFKSLVDKVGNSVQIVGDDLFCTNPKICRQGIERGVANAILIKLNQIGTLSETIETIQMAKEAGWCAVVSHRSGETEDTTIADLAVALGTGQIKTGSMSRSERIAKYNRLMEIEDELGLNAIYEGVKTFVNLKR